MVRIPYEYDLYRFTVRRLEFAGSYMGQNLIEMDTVVGMNSKTNRKDNPGIREPHEYEYEVARALHDAAQDGMRVCARSCIEHI